MVREVQSTSALTRPEQAAERLAALAAAAEPGDRLGTKEEMRAYCGVSVGTFNEALRLVQARGVVVVRTGRVGGLFASHPSPTVRLGHAVLALDADAAAASVVDAGRIRDALDPLMVEHAVRFASAEDLDSMRRELARMSAAADGLDALGFMRANWALHVAIAKASPNAMLRCFYTTMIELIESHTTSVEPAVDQRLADGLARRYRIHVALVDAIADRDEPRAIALIHEHSDTTAGGETGSGDQS
ncbi:FadR/GntR family transcriptional regulator [Cryptosporangium sp. NPDC051539]|uniref:FadR/GntR family transcriptional regulator n=1 Tax=Cryptosporangium sp. NPDC051539 TaxID=3363962 RepID=UPI0037BDFE1C